MAVFTIAMFVVLASAGRGRAAGPTGLPQRIYVSGMDDKGDLVFVLYPDSNIQDGVLVDPKDPALLQFGHVLLPRELPEGRLALLAVPRELSDRADGEIDPEWLKNPPAGVVPVTGVIHNYRIEKFLSSHTYRLSKTDAGLHIELLNPDLLEPYPDEQVKAVPEARSEAGYVWIVVAGGVATLVIGVLGAWTLRARTAPKRKLNGRPEKRTQFGD